MLNKLQHSHKKEDTLETLVSWHYFQIDVKELPAFEPSPFERVQNINKEQKHLKAVVTRLRYIDKIDHRDNKREKNIFSF